MIYKVLIGLGIVFIALGLLWKFAPGLLSWFGKLPGDIRYDKGDVKVFFPITSMLVISFVLSLIIRIIRRFYQ